LSATKIKHVFALADLVVGASRCRNGQRSVRLGQSGAYVPLVPTRGDEQTRNARVCVEAGAATVILQSELSGERCCAK
jgi:UDP-N-acetylglucosamine:LPS N-acetylglucosamine transferase